MRDFFIFQLYPEVAFIRDGDAFDAENNPVEYDHARVDAYMAENKYKYKRAAEYPPASDYLDGIVKGDQAQVQAYIDACKAVKEKYPKE